jgi:phosphoglycolate phosphatase
VEHRESILDYINQHRIKGVIFDFDGTLLDLSVDWYGLRKTLQKEFTIDDISRINELLSVIKKRYGEVGLKKAYQIVEVFEGEHIRETPLLPGRKELVQDIVKKDIIVGIVSNNMVKTITTVITRYQLNDYVPIIIGKDSVMQYKPHSEGIDSLLKAWNMAAINTLLIGNDESDEELSKNAGVHFYKLT